MRLAPHPPKLEHMADNVFQNTKTTPNRSLYDSKGERKYLTPAEREAFLRAADSAARQVRTLCYVLAHTGCRISEALALTADRVDLKGGSLIFESLKKRQAGIFRPVPIPPDLLDALNLVHDLRSAQRRRDHGRGVRLWPFARNTAWRHIGAVMKAAKISGLHASPKGLRHGFGIKAVTVGVPLNMVQRWLGHAQLSTTAITPTPRARKLRNWRQECGSDVGMILYRRTTASVAAAAISDHAFQDHAGSYLTDRQWSGVMAVGSACGP